MPAGVAAAGGIATVLAALTHAAVVDVTGAIAGVAAMFGTAVAIFKRRQILSQFRTQMVRKREDMLAPIEDHLRQAIEAFYHELSVTFMPLQSFVATQRNVYEPLVVRVKQLEETFAKCALSLGLPAEVSDKGS